MSAPYYRFVPTPKQFVLPLDTRNLRPGLRLAVGVSGGADSVALLRALASRSGELGLVVHAAHLHHGLRGAEADGDRDFVRALAERLGIPFHEKRVDTAAEAKRTRATVEEAARHLRYAWFGELLGSGRVDLVATAHTLDDQAETVLGKFLRGAWTEGLSGIHPRVSAANGSIVRPLLNVTRPAIEAFLRGMEQDWREDSSNRHLTFTRNRIRHELLPALETWNPQLRQHLAQMADLAQEEEAWWAAEVARAAPALVLAGRPVRGGGRAGSNELSIAIEALAAQPVAMQRRLLRHVIERLGVALDFGATEMLRELAVGGRAGQKCELASGLRGERTHRELRVSIEPVTATRQGTVDTPHGLTFQVPGEIVAPDFQVRLRVEGDPAAPRSATLRPWRSGDRVTLRYSSGPRKVKEVLERMKVSGSERALWPVLEVDGRILWMRGVVLEPEPGIQVAASDCRPEAGGPVSEA